MKRESGIYLLTVALLAATLAVTQFLARAHPAVAAAPLDSFPAELTGWRITNSEALGARVLERLAPTAYISRTYARSDRRLSLFVAYYAQQRAGESMHSPKHCLPGSGWEIWRQGSARVPFGGRQVQINQYSIQNSGNRMLLLYWYQSRTRIIASEYLGKLLLARDAIVTGNTSGALVRITVPDTPDAAAAGLTFARAVMPEVQRFLAPATNPSPRAPETILPWMRTSQSMR